MGCTPIFKYVPLVRINVQSHTLMTLKFVIAVVSTSRRRRDARSARERSKALAFTARARESSRARSSVDAVAEHLSTDPIELSNTFDMFAAISRTAAPTARASAKIDRTVGKRVAGRCVRASARAVEARIVGGGLRMREERRAHPRCGTALSARSAPRTPWRGRCASSRPRPSPR